MGRQARAMETGANVRWFLAVELAGMFQGPGRVAMKPPLHWWGSRCRCFRGSCTANRTVCFPSGDVSVRDILCQEASTLTMRGVTREGTLEISNLEDRINDDRLS